MKFSSGGTGHEISTITLDSINWYPQVPPGTPGYPQVLPDLVPSLTKHNNFTSAGVIPGNIPVQYFSAEIAENFPTLLTTLQRLYEAQ